MNKEEQKSKVEFVKNIDNFVKENPVLERFFKGKENFIQDLARNAAELAQDPNTSLDVLRKTVMVTLHQQVVYCGEYFVPQSGSRDITNCSSLTIP